MDSSLFEIISESEITNVLQNDNNNDEDDDADLLKTNLSSVDNIKQNTIVQQVNDMDNMDTNKIIKNSLVSSNKLLHISQTKLDNTNNTTLDKNIKNLENTIEYEILQAMKKSNIGNPYKRINEMIHAKKNVSKIIEQWPISSYPPTSFEKPYTSEGGSDELNNIKNPSEIFSRNHLAQYFGDTRPESSDISIAFKNAEDALDRLLKDNEIAFFIQKSTNEVLIDFENAI